MRSYSEKIISSIELFQKTVWLKMKHLSLNFYKKKKKGKNCLRLSLLSNKAVESGRDATHLWTHLLQRGERGDVRVRHGPCNRNPKQETRLHIAGEIKPWRDLSMKKTHIWTDRDRLTTRGLPPMCEYLEAVSPPSGPCARRRPISSSCLPDPAARRKRAALLHTRLTTNEDMRLQALIWMHAWSKNKHILYIYNCSVMEKQKHESDSNFHKLYHNT